jgi:hypothetical protein
MAPCGPLYSSPETLSRLKTARVFLNVNDVGSDPKLLDTLRTYVWF